MKSRRRTDVKQLKDHGEKRCGIVTGFAAKRRFEIDFSPLSLLDGSSGIDFPKRVRLLVTTKDGTVHESDLTNVPEQTAQHYVQEKMSLTVYVGDEGSYVDIDELPPFELLDLFTSHK